MPTRRVGNGGGSDDGGRRKRSGEIEICIIFQLFIYFIRLGPLYLRAAHWSVFVSDIPAGASRRRAG